jgi:hypothetical protein
MSKMSKMSKTKSKYKAFKAFIIAYAVGIAIGMAFLSYLGYNFY